MNITNKNNLPAAVLSAISAFQINYENSKTGKEKFTVTELLKPSWQRYLQKKHKDEIEEDASDRIWALLGQSIHAILQAQKTDNSLLEERLYREFENIIISGQLDYYSDNILDDYKLCSVWKFIKGDYYDYEAQLNLNAWLIRGYGFEIKEIRAILIFRDWSKSKAKYDNSYPQSPIKIISLPIWTDKHIEDFIKERIESHNNPEVCSQDDRWGSHTMYAVMKNNNKTATRLLPTMDQAEQYIKNIGETKDKYRIDIRPGKNVRCDDYCNVKEFCSFYKGKENNEFICS